MRYSNDVGSYPATLQPRAVQESVGNKHSIQGVAIAACIIVLWMFSLGCLLAINLVETPVWLIALAVLWQMFLYTGLFITAHDAMHGSVSPQNPSINAVFGKLTVLAYGFFSYRKLLQKHWQHHRHPATEIDPDFHNGINTHPIAWYLHFMMRYWDWRQWIGLALIFNVAEFGLHIPESNLILFWVLPPLLSSVQLFYFGTFLTHREPEAGYTHPDRAKTNPLPVFWSFITCYHFGYHEEHHEYPHVPWWQLPTIYRQRTQLVSTSCN